MTAQFITTRRVEFADTDMAGIIHFANYYRYMEEAEHAFFRSLGLGIMQSQSDGSVIGWPRVSASCSFEAPAYFEDALEVRLNVVRKGVKSLNYEIEFWRRDAAGSWKTEDRVLCLSARSAIGIDRDSRRVRRRDCGSARSICGKFVNPRLRAHDSLSGCV